jgi:hypothetical protein
MINCTNVIGLKILKNTYRKLYVNGGIKLVGYNYKLRKSEKRVGVT